MALYKKIGTSHRRRNGGGAKGAPQCHGIMTSVQKARAQERSIVGDCCSDERGGQGL